MNAVKKLGDNESDIFIDEVETFIGDFNDSSLAVIESQIEQILLTALLFIMKKNSVHLSDPILIDEFKIVAGLIIDPQFEIGPYRVDFRIENRKQLWNEKNDIIADESKIILVECDSQEWHERSEKERRYEKARDRYFAKKGLKIFHYTGKEITEDPAKVAAEILREIK